MDDDEEIEIHSHPSPMSGSGSPVSSPGTIGRISVTVAAPAPYEQSQAMSYALALPIQNQPRGNNGGGREDCWSEGATAILIEAWGERYLELSRGNLKQKHWKEVAEIVSSREDLLKTPKTDIQCKNRIDTVKKKYKSEKAKIVAGGGIATSKWPFYDRLDYLIGPTAKISGVSGTGNSNLPPQKVPLGIPVSLRAGGSANRGQFNSQKKNQQQKVEMNYQKVHLRTRVPEVDSDNSSEREQLSPVSSDSLPPEPEGFERKRAKVTPKRRKGKGWGSEIRELTQAIVKFGEAYEQAETLKLQQVVEMEKQRMKFAKDLELQRMQFFMKTQMEISQIKIGRKNGNGNGNTSNHHNNKNENINNNNNDHHNNNSESE